ncbi:hypothetical protein RBH29_10765 [Herbivorax sp. ANBcel31]|uniref:hypothetical protein n=1 Tax=Herbivorax sp. ANBcel31 TaxID=3069754 RepID=UPI0027B217B9|nr:hypothetical protein [Herbivorax sp. ANBcel31]MDQ2086908.1 hypothetical protein [Herbivorax sp. ANBcel31]
MINKVLALTFKEAKEIIEKEGRCLHSVKVTSPPKHLSNEYDDYYRVINAKELNKLDIELIVCKPLF